MRMHGTAILRAHSTITSLWIKLNAGIRGPDDKRTQTLRAVIIYPVSALYNNSIVWGIIYAAQFRVQRRVAGRCIRFQWSNSNFARGKQLETDRSYEGTFSKSI